MVVLQFGNPYHVFETKVIMDEKKIFPPGCFADFCVVANNQIPLWSWSKNRKYECAE